MARPSCELSWTPRCRLFVGLEGCVCVCVCDPWERMLWQRQKERHPQFCFLTTEETVFLSLSLSRRLSPLRSALRFFFSFLSATWPLKESDEFTADSLWLRGSGEQCRMTLSEAAAYRYKKKKKKEKKRQTEREYYGALLSV